MPEDQTLRPYSVRECGGEGGILTTAALSFSNDSVNTAQASGKIGEEPPDVPNIKKAVEKYLADAEARHLAPETVRKRRELLEGKLLPFCESKGYEILTHLDVDVLRTFRASWPYSPLSARKRLEYLRSFFRFCHDGGWIDRNPAMAVKASKVEQNPTLPFTDQEIERILDAARKLNAFGRYGPKIEPMVLLLRYSGLCIQDAACLERARLEGDKLFLYQQKTGNSSERRIARRVLAGLRTSRRGVPNRKFQDWMETIDVPAPPPSH